MSRSCPRLSLAHWPIALDGLLWPGNRLLPVEADVAEAESWPLLLTFQDLDVILKAVRVALGSS